MRKFIYWYKKEIIAKNLNIANRQEKKTKLILDQINVENIKKEQLTDCFGFTVDREQNYEDDDY